MYKLNQIETDLRKRISEDIDTSKVHGQQDKIVKNNTHKQNTYEDGRIFRNITNRSTK